MTVLARLWRSHRGPLLAFAAAAAVTLFFAVRLILFAVYWSNPAHRDQHPAGWMTPGYVARSWHVPREELVGALGLTLEPGRPRTLAEIAATRGEPLDDLLGTVEKTVAALRDEQAGQ